MGRPEFEGSLRRYVEVVGRLVKEQHGVLLHREHREDEARALAVGEHADGRGLLRRVEAEVGQEGTPLLLVLGASSVVYWSITEAQGNGDLRFYGFIQYFPILLLPILCKFFQNWRHTNGKYLFWIVVC